MAITTSTGHVKQALDFINQHKDTLYFEFAHSQDWTDPNTPNPEVDNIVSLDDPQAFLKVDQLLLCEETDQPAKNATNTDKAIVYKNKYWTIVDLNTVLDKQGHATNQAYYVCLVGTLGVDKLSPFKYTQIGVVNNPTFAGNLDNTHEVVPAQVTSSGELMFYENRLQENYTKNTAKVVKYMLKF